LRTPEEFDGTEWFRYFTDAVSRETGEAWSPPGFEVNVWLKLLKRLRDDGAGGFQLALAIDLIAMRWNYLEKRSPWELITPGRLFYPFRNLSRPVSFWRGVWFSRYAETDEEIRYFDHWLAQLEAAVQADPGTRGKSGHWQVAEQKLTAAEGKILDRNQAPSFEFNWLKQWTKEMR